MSALVVLSPSEELTIGASLLPPALARESLLLAQACGAPSQTRAREEAMRALFLDAGATPNDLHMQDIRPRLGIAEHNVIVRRAGGVTDAIVVAAHLDHRGGGRGVVDDWTGIVVIANVYAALRTMPLHHTIIFAGFGGEETGLRGSRSFVAQPGVVPPLKAVVNLECLGVGPPQYWWNGSSKALGGLLHRVARREAIPLSRHLLFDVTADTLPFADHGIPTITIDGLPAERASVVHSPEDDCPAVGARHLYQAYTLTLAFILELDRALVTWDGRG